MVGKHHSSLCPKATTFERLQRCYSKQVGPGSPLGQFDTVTSPPGQFEGVAHHPGQGCVWCVLWRASAVCGGVRPFGRRVRGVLSVSLSSSSAAAAAGKIFFFEKIKIFFFFFLNFKN